MGEHPMARPLELWIGPECTINRVGDRWRDQSILTGFSRRPDDIDRLASLGAKRVRFPVLWERAAAVPRALDFSWTDHAFSVLQSHGLQPIVGLLHHGSGPRHTSLVDPHFPLLFAEYARQVAERYPEVTCWTPINEPLTTARFSCLYGLWYPHAADDASFVRALLNQVHATVLAMRAIRAINPAAQLVQTDDLGFTRSTPALADQAAFDNERRWLAFDLLCGRVVASHPLWKWLRGCGAREEELARLQEAPCPPDIIGINAYVTSERFLDDRLDLHPPHLHGGNAHQAYADVETVRAHGELIDGFGVRLREAHARYDLPLAITEVHMGCTREEQLRWLQQAWTAAVEARRDGIDVLAVTAWAAFGTVDWSSLLTRENGHYEPGLWDARSDPPRLTALGRLAGALGRGEQPSRTIRAVTASVGWWQRDLRLNVAPHGAVTALPATGPTLLIVGRNAIAHAFARLSHMRGLPYERLISIDLLAPDAVLNLLQTRQAWAVVDTAPEGPQALALSQACARAAVLRLVIHAAASPTASRPERLDSDQRDLHVHTGRLFGPWTGEDDALSASLASLVRGQPQHLDATERLWPTYIPDLVQAALDLLIDGEVGDWWLTHGESSTWWAFVRRAARLAGHDESLVHGVREQIADTPYAESAGGLLPSLDNALSRYLIDYESEPGEPPPLRSIRTADASFDRTAARAMV